MNNEQRLKKVREAIHFTEQSKKDFDAYHDGAPVKEFDTILLALRVMEKMLGEPSEGMVKSGKHALLHSTEHCLVTAGHRGMVQQAIKELEE